MLIKRSCFANLLTAVKAGFLDINRSVRIATLDPKCRVNAFSRSTLPFIGQAVAQALAPSIAPNTANKVLYVRSFTVSQDQVLAVAEKATGGKPWKVDSVDLPAKGDRSEVLPLLQDVILDSAA